MRSFAGVNPNPTGPSSGSDDGTSITADGSGVGGDSDDCKQNKQHSEVARPTGTQLRHVFIASAVPMVGFGFMDNLVMIAAGDLIDNTIGVRLGLATLTAAACGQVFSDVSGVCFGGVVDAACVRMGLPVPDLDTRQRQLGIVKRVGTFGAVCGVILGCTLGMTSLLFIDLDAAERAKREKELDTIFQTVILEGAETLRADRSSLFLVDHDKQECWSRAATGIKAQIRVPIGTSLVGACVQKGESMVVEDAYSHDKFNPAHDKLSGYRTRGVMCIPVVHANVMGEDQESRGKVLAVVQFVNKRNGEAWSMADRRSAEMLARHVGIFLEQVGTD